MIVTSACMSITTNIQLRSERGSRMKLKDKKIDIQGVQYITDNYGNHKKETVTIATVWAYFRQLSGNEIYRVTTHHGRGYVCYQLPHGHNNRKRDTI